MKISAIASILAFVAAPLSAFATTYTCTVDAGFKLDQADGNNPVYPTTAEKNLAAATLQSSYEALEHDDGNSDFSMTGISVTDFTLDGDPEGLNKNKNLRTGSGAAHQFDAVLKSTSSVACNLCGSWNDDDAAGAALDTADWLAETHSRWIPAFCDELNHLADIFEDSCFDCYINLTCTTSLSNNEHDIEVIKIHEGEAAMKNEDIEMEVDASRH
jgi:hypothetical protein